MNYAWGHAYYNRFAFWAAGLDMLRLGAIANTINSPAALKHGLRMLRRVFGTVRQDK
jgi:hypothetical protein